MLRKKVALATGAGQGIDLEICRELRGVGARVILNDLDTTLASKAAAITSEGGVCIPIAGDSGDANVIEQMVKTAVTSFGHLDITIANAGITLYGDFFSYTPEAFFKFTQVNLGGTFFQSCH